MREGRYKYQLVTQEELLHEAPLFLQRIKPLEPAQVPQDFLAQAQLCAAYILEYSKMRFGKKFKQAPLSWEKLFSPPEFARCLKLGPHAKWTYQDAKAAYQELIQKEYFNQTAAFQLRAIPFSASRSLVGWALGLYPLHLFLNVPSPLQVMKFQTVGERVVSLIFKGDEFVEGGREPLGFALHDLIHADHFYRDDRVAMGQIGFSKWVEGLFQMGRFDEMLKSPVFQKEFYYTVSDMNAYCVHLLKCLKANILNWYLEQESKSSRDVLSESEKRRFESFWSSLFTEVNSQELNHFLNLNEVSKAYDAQIIEHFFIAKSSLRAQGELRQERQIVSLTPLL